MSRLDESYSNSLQWLSAYEHRSPSDLSADTRMPGGDVVCLGIDLPRHQGRARELSAVLPGGLTLPRRGITAAALGAVARAEDADVPPMAQCGDRRHGHAWPKHGRSDLCRAIGTFRPCGRLHRHRPGSDYHCGPPIRT